MQLKSEEKNIQLTSKIQDDLIAYYDYNMVNTVLRNLITNSLKYTPQDGKVTVDAIPKNNHIEISVTDTGIGISQTDIEKLFSLGDTKSTIGINGEKGTGLGLLLCFEFVQNHGGEIWAESKENQGSTFKFTLPAIKQT